MAELTISTEEIRGALERYVSSYSTDVSREEVGTVADTGDGIAHVEGLPSTMTNEPPGVRGRHARCGAEPRRPGDRCRRSR